MNGTPSTKQTPSGELERWARNSEITVYVDQSVDQIGPGARDVVMSSFGAWIGSGASVPRLRFDTATGLAPKLTRDGKSSVVYAPIDIPGHKNDLAITVSFVEPNGRLLEADIILNSNKEFAQLPPDASADDAADCNAHYDLQSVVTHESGHFFGLDEDMDDTESTMFFKTARCELKKRDLTVPDVTTMAALYASAPDGETGPESTSTASCSASACTKADSTFAWVTGALLCGIAVRRRRLRTR